MCTSQLTTTLHGLTTPDARKFAQAGFLRAAQLDIPTPAAINIIRAARPTDPSLSRLLNHRPTVARLVSESTTIRSRSASPSVAARARVRAARQVVARVLGGDYTWSERAILALLGLRLIESGWPTVQVAPATLAVDLGMSEEATRAALHRLVEKGALRQTSKRPGHTSIWKVAKLASPAEREGLGALFDTIGALANSTEDPVADAIRGVTSPEWGYAPERTWRHWVGTVAVAAGRQMPCSRRVHLATARELAAPVDLDAAAAVKEATAEARAERAAARVADVTEAREAWTELTAWLGRVEEKLEPAWKAKSDADRAAWLTGLDAHLGDLDPAKFVVLARVLRSHLRKAKWAEELVESAVGSLSTPSPSPAGSDVEQAMVEWVSWLESQVGSAADTSDRAAWLGAAAEHVAAVPESARQAGAEVLAGHLADAGWAPESRDAVDHLFGIG